MLDVPQPHDLFHFFRCEVCWMRAQKPEPEVAVKFINRKHGLNQSSKARPIPVDVLSQEEQLRETTLNGPFGSMQDFAGVDNDLGTSRQVSTSPPRLDRYLLMFCPRKSNSEKPLSMARSARCRTSPASTTTSGPRDRSQPVLQGSTDTC